eukprot:4463311-Karenia_brevis.AAC.1
MGAIERQPLCPPLSPRNGIGLQVLGVLAMHPSGHQCITSVDGQVPLICFCSGYSTWMRLCLPHVPSSIWATLLSQAS